MTTELARVTRLEDVVPALERDLGYAALETLVQLLDSPAARRAFYRELLARTHLPLGYEGFRELAGEAAFPIRLILDTHYATPGWGGRDYYRFTAEPDGRWHAADGDGVAPDYSYDGRTWTRYPPEVGCAS